MTRPLWIDTRWLGPTGIGRFTQEVVGRLEGWAPLPGTLRRLHPLEPMWLARQIARWRPAAYFSPGFNPPARSRCPLLFTLHDLIHLRVRREATIKFRLYYEAIVRPAAWRAERVLTVSEFSRRDILAWTGLPAERVVVVGNGVGAEFGPIGRTHPHRRGYVLCVSNAFPHKNLPRLLQAFAGTRARRDLDLVIVGPRDPDLLALRATLGLETAVHLSGPVEAECLPRLYRGAVACVCPSLFEGFGLPALEAMASGTPVAVADRTSLPEVVGPAGLTFDPTRPDAIAAAIDRLVEDEGLRRRLVAAGLERARAFTWDAVAERVAAALRPYAEVRTRVGSNRDMNRRVA
ncbi:MAG TPA: glycosyltransferase family 1 protein [Kofleriaceae bacterium]|nr:glycosyltransferase family 1 protein [Kofleriaceae bacterium]